MLRGKLSLKRSKTSINNDYDVIIPSPDKDSSQEKGGNGDRNLDLKNIGGISLFSIDNPSKHFNPPLCSLLHEMWSSRPTCKSHEYAKLPTHCHRSPITSKNLLQSPKAEDASSSHNLKKMLEWEPFPISNIIKNKNFRKSPASRSSVSLSSNLNENLEMIKELSEIRTGENNSQLLKRDRTIDNSVENKFEPVNKRASIAFFAKGDLDLEPIPGPSGIHIQEMSKHSSDIPLLKECPLCQQLFPDGISQIDLDAHIAACLSTADDIDW